MKKTSLFSVILAIAASIASAGTWTSVSPTQVIIGDTNIGRICEISAGSSTRYVFVINDEPTQTMCEIAGAHFQAGTSFGIFWDATVTLSYTFRTSGTALNHPEVISLGY